jgi:phage terminase large subunit
VYYYNGGYILDEQLYQKGLSNKQIADFIKNLENAQLMIKADSAEPKSIDEIKMFGVNIVPTVKGKDSINQGIQRVQDQRISVTRRSVNLIKEYQRYMWDTDKEGRTLNKPMDMWNHAMDAIRYAFEGFAIEETPAVTFSGGDSITGYGAHAKGYQQANYSGYTRR